MYRNSSESLLERRGGQAHDSKHTIRQAHDYAAHDDDSIYTITVPEYSGDGPLMANTSVFKKILTWASAELRRVFVDPTKESTTLVH